MGSAAEAFELAHYGIVAALADRLGVVEFLDRHVAGASSRQESPGRWAKILLCRAPEFSGGAWGVVDRGFDHLPTAHLLGGAAWLSPPDSSALKPFLEDLGNEGISKLHERFVEVCLGPLLPQRCVLWKEARRVSVRRSHGGRWVLSFDEEMPPQHAPSPVWHGVLHTVTEARGWPLLLAVRPWGCLDEPLPAMEKVQALLGALGKTAEIVAAPEKSPGPPACSWHFAELALDNEHLVEGACFVWTVVRALWALGEEELRARRAEALAEISERPGTPLEGPRTLGDLLELFARATLLWHGEEGGEVLNLTEAHHRVFDLLGDPFRRYYGVPLFAKAGRNGGRSEDLVAEDGTPRDPAYFVAAARDMGNWRRTENHLRILSRAIEASPVGVVITDPQGTIQYVNPRFQDMTGFSFQESLGRNPRMLKSGYQDEAFYQHLWSTLLEGREWRGELCNKRKNGELYWVRASISPVRDSAGTMVHFVAIQENITAEREAAEELARARDAADAANRAKSDFLARMSHEIRTPMNGVLGMAEILQRTELSPRQHRYLEIIQTSAESLLGIINDILDLSKIEAGFMSFSSAPFDFRKTAEDVLLLMAARARTKGLELVLRYAPGTPRMLVGDGGRLRQVLINLVGNAVKFTESGYVLLEVSSVPQDNARVLLRFRVMDTGMGIAPEDQPHVFQPFAQGDTSSSRRFQGTGLGLTISRQLVELMQGHITVESQVGQGSVFTVTLPVDTLPEGEPPAFAAVPGGRVLVVDDMPPNRLLLEEYLAARGVEVVSVESARRAREALLDAEQQGRPFALILVDRQMPGEGGPELVRSLPQVLRTVPPCVLLSTLGDEGGDEATLFAAVLTKPLRQDQIDALFDRMFRGDGGAAEKNLRIGAEEPPLGRHVLLVEDHPVNREVGALLLAQAGCTVDLAANGLEAVRAVQERGGRYDAVLMDCQMPEMDGYEATQQIRKREGGARRVPILALTASATEVERRRCFASGMDDVLVKPISRAALAAALERYPRRDEHPGPFSESFFPVDRSVLADQVGDDPEILEEMYRQFLMVHQDDLALLEAALSRRERDALRRAAHRIKGSAASVGARFLAEAGGELERRGQEAREEEILVLVEAVRRCSREVQRFLERDVAPSEELRGEH